MNHVDYTPGVMGRESSTPIEWLPLGRQITELVNAWSNRNDIVAFVGPGAGGKTAAFFTPATAEMELSIPMAFGASVQPGDIGKRWQERVRHLILLVILLGGYFSHEACTLNQVSWSGAYSATTIGQ